MIVKRELEEVVEILDQLGNPYYFHAGFGLYLRGIEGELDDCDARVFHPDIREVYEFMKRRSSHEVRLRGVVSYQHGTYVNDCVQILNETDFDICSRMITECDIGRFEYPFSEEIFSDVDQLPYQGMTLPVASAESLFLYYLVHRRGIIDGKNDGRRVRDLLHSDQFNRNKFEGMIPSLSCSEAILKLYENALREHL